MKRETPLTTSIKARLQNLAREQSRPFNDILQFYIIERFLYRLSRSPFAKRFVLKGALMLVALDVPSLRPTRDIDLLGHTGNDLPSIEDVFRQICVLHVEPNDGVQFDPDSVKAVPIIEKAKYQGVRVHLTAYLGKARIPLQIDIGFGDPLISTPQRIQYPALLPSLPSPELQGYPVENIIAEKVQTMVYLGEVNSRLKDFYDVWVLLQHFPVTGTSLQRALRQTFRSRGTRIPKSIPAAWTERFAAQKQRDWQAFLKRNGLEAPTLSQVIDELRKRLWPQLQAIAEE